MLELNRLMLKDVVGGDCECYCYYDDREDGVYRQSQGLLKDEDECEGVCEATRYCNEDHWLWAECK